LSAPYQHATMPSGLRMPTPLQPLQPHSWPCSKILGGTRVDEECGQEGRVGGDGRVGASGAGKLAGSSQQPIITSIVWPSGHGARTRQTGAAGSVLEQHSNRKGDRDTKRNAQKEGSHHSFLHRRWPHNCQGCATSLSATTRRVRVQERVRERLRLMVFGSAPLWLSLLLRTLPRSLYISRPFSLLCLHTFTDSCTPLSFVLRTFNKICTFYKIYPHLLLLAGETKGAPIYGTG